MRRFAHSLFTTFAAASLLMCVAIGMAWARGFSAEVIYGRHPRPAEADTVSLYVVSDGGTLALRLGRVNVVRPDVGFLDAQWTTYVQMAHPAGVRWRTAHGRTLSSRPRWSTKWDLWRHWSGDGWYRGGSWAITGPHWLVMAVLLVPPTAWLVRFRRARRLARTGCCAACGYDLRATPDRCPECGAVAPSHPAFTPRGGAVSSSTATAARGSSPAPRRP